MKKSSKPLFNSLSLKPELLKNLKTLGYDFMTPVQEKSLPHLLDSKDMFVQAKTGSGKTAAFGLNILNSLDTEILSIQSLILCPTRELAQQVASEVRLLARMMPNIKVTCITGGEPEYYQEKSLAHGVHIVVGTPGRVLKFIERGLFDFSSLKHFVLDEADRMLDMGFQKDILSASRALPKERQTLLFSATFTDIIKSLGKDLQREEELIVSVKVDDVHESQTIIERFFELDSHKDKSLALLKLLNFYRPTRFIIFCKTKIFSDKVSELLRSKDIFVEAIHGDLSQNERTEVLSMFSNGSLNGLVATDVAARGLDIKDLDMVINFDLPGNGETYVHRIGRTARAGKNGLAMSFLVMEERDKLDAISLISKKPCETEDIYSLERKPDYKPIPLMRTLYISGGKKDKLRAGDIVGTILGNTDLAKNEIGDIKIMLNTSFVAIKREVAEKVVEVLMKERIKKRRFRVGLL